MCDKFKPNIKEYLNTIKREEKNTVLLTRDNDMTVKRTSKTPGITKYYANMTPDKKLHLMQKTTKRLCSRNVRRRCQ